MQEKIKVVIGGDASGAKRALSEVGDAASDAVSSVAAASAVFAGAFALVEGSVIAVSAEFERYETQLTTIESSSSKAAASMAWVTEFAAKTPYDLSQVTEAFVKLKAYGIDPVANDALRTLGDTAAEMGKPLNQAVEALSDAATGEFERLKEFGVKASVVGDQVSFAYSQNGKTMVATANKNSSEMIQATLQGIWNDKFSGGMDKLSQTWGGMTSNLGDNWMLFQKQIGDNGAFDAAKSSLALVLEEISANDEGIKSLATNISNGLVTAMQIGVTAAALLAKGYAATDTAMDGVRIAIDSVVLAAVQGFDIALAGLQSFYDALAKLPAGLGDPYANASASIGAFRQDLAHLEAGIAETGGESLNTLFEGVDDLGKQFDVIDEKAVKFVSAMEMARNAVKEPVPNLEVSAADSGSAASSSPASAGGGNKALDDLASRLEALNVQLMSDEVRLEHVYINRVQLVADAIGSNVVAEQRGLQIVEQLTLEHQSNLKALHDEASIAIEAADESGLLLKVEGFAQQLLSEEELLQNSHINRAQIVADAIGENIISEQRGMQVMSGLSMQHETAMLKLRKTAQKSQLENVGDTLSTMAGLMNSKSRAMFEVGKAASISLAGLKTYEAATNAYAAASAVPLVGWLLGPLAAAAAVAAGVANVQKIASTSYGSAPSGGASSVSAPSLPSVPSPSVSSSPSQIQESQNQGRVVNLHLNVGFLDADLNDTQLAAFADKIASPVQDALDRGLGRAA